MTVLLFSLPGRILVSVVTVLLVVTSGFTLAENNSVKKSNNQVVTTEFELSFELESLGDLAAITGIDLPPTGPVTLKTNINVTGQGYTLSDIRFTAGNSDLSGDLAVSYTGNRPALTARLHSNHLDLAELYTDDVNADKPELVASEEPVSGDVEKIFSSKPLPFDFIRNVDMDFNYSASSILGHKLELNNFEIDALQSNGDLKIQTLTADVANGKLVASGSINAANVPPLVNLQMNINNMEPGQLPDIRKLDAVEGLPTDITFKATGTGNSIAEIMSTLTGSFLSKSGKGVNYVEQVNLLEINFLIEALNILNPFRKKQNESPINCIVTRFTINNGEAISVRGIAAQTQNLNVIGGGIIDLKNEQFDLVVHPEARSGINIGAITLVDAVRVSGKFSDPDVNPETQAALLKRAGTVGAALVTGGLSYIAQKLFEHTRFKDDPCGEALQENSSANSPDNNKPEDASAQ